MNEWDHAHGTLVEPVLYGDPTTYAMAADAVSRCRCVQDWGCGGGGLRDFLHPSQVYIGVDGSDSPFASVHADLRYWRSDCDGVVLRHVLEHNDHWADILDNAAATARKVLVVVLFTPMVEHVVELLREVEYGNVPVLSFATHDILDRLTGWKVDIHSVDSPGTFFGVETVFVARR